MSSPNERAWGRFRRNRRAVISAWFLLMLAMAVAAWPAALKCFASLGGATGEAFAVRYDPDRVSDEQFQPPNRAHWCGTDVHGRDLLSRIMYGAQVSLLVGSVGAGVSLVIGVLWGAIAGLAGGRTDSLMMRFVDVLYSLPSIIFVIVLITTLEEGFARFLSTVTPAMAKFARLLFLFVGLGAVSWLTMARIVRGQVLSLKTRPYVEASRGLGAGPAYILFRHILPNVLGVVIIYLALTVPAVILYESFLSYLGLGIQPPMASWGSLIAEGAEQMNPIRMYWWLIAFPGVFLVSTLLALNFVGDGLRDAWDVRGT
jgi:peptide/nickel transport system permease protein/oligopeptide transport system permease protein